MGIKIAGEITYLYRLTDIILLSSSIYLFSRLKYISINKAAKKQLILLKVKTIKRSIRSKLLL
jgi:hypothetical protein